MAEHPARQDPRPTAASMLHLQPPAIPHGGTSKWQTSGRTLGAAMHPATAELAIHVAAQSQRTETSGAYDQDKVVYLGKWEEMPAQLNKVGRLGPVKQRNSLIRPSYSSMQIRTPSSSPYKAFTNLSFEH